MATIRQKHHLNATPEEIYIALTNPFTIELWTGYKAEMSEVPGSEFSMFDGDITGKNLEFVTEKLIRQQWYFEGEAEESIVTLTLKPEKTNTVVELLHTHVPDEAEEEMREGWKKMYFEALKHFFK